MTEPSRHFERVDWSARDEPPHSPPDPDEWPFTIPAVAQLVAEGGLELPAGVTFLVGENGSDKSTLVVEALAAVYPRRGFVTPFVPKTGPTRASRTRRFAGDSAGSSDRGAPSWTHPGGTCATSSTDPPV